jgi:hypothetical protein
MPGERKRASLTLPLDRRARTGPHRPIALSSPKPSGAGEEAIRPATRATPLSIVIHPRLSQASRRARRISLDRSGPKAERLLHGHPSSSALRARRLRRNHIGPSTAVGEGPAKSSQWKKPSRFFQAPFRTSSGASKLIRRPAMADPMGGPRSGRRAARARSRCHGRDRAPRSCSHGSRPEQGSWPRWRERLLATNP